MRYEAIVIGASSGGMNAIKFIVSLLPENFSIPIICVLHVSPHSDSQWITFLKHQSKLIIKEADEKEQIQPGSVYIAPPNYHLLIEKDKTFSLTVDERVNFARPSIDVLFESAAYAHRHRLIGIVLTGSNSDGAGGIKQIKESGGMVIIQKPETAESPYMPAAAAAITQPDYILTLEDIAELLIKIDKQQKKFYEPEY